MTWSLLARTDDGRFGAAIASRFFAVGALCVHTRRGVGAVAFGGDLVSMAQPRPDTGRVLVTI